MLKRALLIAGIVAVAAAIAIGLSKMKPPPPSEAAGDVDLLIDVMTLESDDYAFSIESQGTVRPLTETALSAEVAGQITGVSPKFLAGGVFAAGEELMRIDQTNYIGNVAEAEALVKQRQIEFEGARSLRTQGYRAETELAAAEAALATAQANLTRARRDLDRTRIRLPYAGMVRSRNADLGQYVNPGQQLGVVFATDYAEVRLPLTDQDLAFVDLPDATKLTEAGVATAGPAVTLSAVQRGRRVSWPAQIVRSEGVVDERARVTYAVARIADPYGLLDADASTPPLPMGTFVSASIDGASVEDAVRLPRGAIRRNNEVVFVDENNRLRLEPVTVLHADAEYAYVAGAGTAGKRISLTAIESPINGMKVRTASGRDDAEQRLAIDSEATSGDTGDQK